MIPLDLLLFREMARISRCVELMEELDASEKGPQPQDDQPQHQNGDAPRQAAEASRGDSVVSRSTI